MICISIAEPTVEKCLAALDGISFAEIRIDGMAADEEDIRRIFSGHQRLIATCRPGDISEGKRKALLLAALKAGAAYVDIEFDAEEKFKKDIVGAAAVSAGCQVIVSSHNFDGTPPREVAKENRKLVLCLGGRYRQNRLPRSLREGQCPPPGTSRRSSPACRHRSWKKRGED